MSLFVLILPFILSALSAYLIGSISFSIIFTKLLLKTDVREHGSGNAGTTNVLRTAGKLPALLTLLFDFLKAVVAIEIARFLLKFFYSNMSGNPQFLQLIVTVSFVAGIFCILGHIYPLYFNFRGGKGALTAVALVALIDWRIFIVEILIFAIVVVISKYVSAGTVIAAIAYPIATLLLLIFWSNNPNIGYALLDALFALFIAAIVIYKHTANIKRLLNGTELKLGQKKKE
jgi:glycerol-3-phosphate acyltransferase PlsY